VSGHVLAPFICSLLYPPSLKCTQQTPSHSEDSSCYIWLCTKPWELLICWTDGYVIQHLSKDWYGLVSNRP